MINRRFILGAVAAAMTAVSTSPAWADWPEKAITFVIGFREGGGTDTMMRYIGNRLEDKLGVAVVMENRSGGGGTVASTYLKDQAADGHTFAAAITSTYSFNTLAEDAPYAIDDFTYIAGVNRYSEAYLSKDAHWSSFEEMVAFGKERGHLSYASLIPLDRLVMQALAKKAGFELDILPTRGGSEARAALLAGDADFTMVGASGFNMIGENDVIGLATPNPERLSTLPDLPTINELGYAGYVVNFGTVVAPAGLPEDIRDKMSAAINEITSEDGFVELVQNRLGATPMQISASELDAMIREQASLFGSLKAELE
ncbi:MAG: tripartite tricarboxylate transporter substrate binding protein [Boseongicola sp. SB0664_bin_43]|uniref:Tripartite tricarboxylate transporter substrate binding protein n=1 Tax=Boseongicola sp. SB0664_bin_43 TaxID=2604844 RepID=A0A6B0XXZ2_9RHOB|nr:tripartite tricarboxylate transporter substrate binding protein [Boseongicola sp. SB0664_bin_43]MYK30203.1 tripartite tricarboxylate transporter substrate binding protein [Boseongicola sp. SB0670_bin_30]